MKRTAIALGLLAGVAILASSNANAGGSFQTLPGIGYPAYCASTVSGTGSLSGITGTGQGTTGSICGQTVPAGPATFLGSEVAPFDLFTPGTSSAAGGASAGPVQTCVCEPHPLAQGAIVDLDHGRQHDHGRRRCVSVRRRDRRLGLHDHAARQTRRGSVRGCGMHGVHGRQSDDRGECGPGLDRVETGLQRRCMHGRHGGW